MESLSKPINHLKPWLPLAAAVLAAVVAVSAQPPEPETPSSGAAQTGNITGKVTAGKGISVVWVEAAPGVTFPKPNKTATVSQKALRFVPHVMAIPAGETVDFLNGDNVQQHLLAGH